MFIETLNPKEDKNVLLTKRKDEHVKQVDIKKKQELTCHISAC